jgi:hypothetical protein
VQLAPIAEDREGARRLKTASSIVGTGEETASMGFEARLGEDEGYVCLVMVNWFNLSLAVFAIVQFTGAYIAATGARNMPPRIISAQAIRAILLATAMMTTFGGRRCCRPSEYPNAATRSARNISKSTADANALR